MRYSKQREMILEAVKSKPTHPTADEIYTRLKKDHPELSLGTVYRNLKLLCELGELLKIEVLGDSDHFDGTTCMHFHMSCARCKKIFDIPEDIAPNLKQSVLEKTGYKIKSYDIAFYGLCHTCQKEDNHER